MQELIFVIHILSIVALIGLVLVQHGKGADMGAAFGSGASNTMFGSGGSISFFTKVTAVIALIFFITSVGLGIMVAKQAKQIAAATSIPGVPQERGPIPIPLDEV